MQKQSNLIRLKRRTIFPLAVIMLALIGVTPALADYLGPNRTITENTSVCKIVLNRCQFVPAKDEYHYKEVNDWSCSNEDKPWQEYRSSPARPCTQNAVGEQYWDRDDVSGTVTNTYPPATINSSLQNCTLQNGWCVTPPQLDINGIEPVAGHSIVAIEGSLNGQTFACMNSSCSVPLSQGNNNLTYWALSTFGDSSTMGTFTANVDSQLPNITGAFAGLSGSNGWYLGPATFNGSASDATSGLASFTCTLDGVGLGSCNTITVNSEGLHTVVLTAQDNAGHTRTITQNASIDTQNPTLNAAINGTLGSNSWYTSAALHASASDSSPGSGLAVFEYNFDGTGWTAFPSSGVLSLSNGKHGVDIRAMDQAGHTVSSSRSYWLDTSAPHLTVDSDGTNGANGWYTTKPLITASANDGISGMDILEYSLDSSSWTTYVTPVTLSDGIHHLSFWAQDQAGLVTQVNRTYQVDTHAPEIAGGLSGIPGLNGWYISEVTLSASASDPLSGSGLDSFTYIINGNTETPYTDPLTLSDGHYHARLTALDQAGLSYSIDRAFQIDTTYPSLKIKTVLPNWVKDKVTLSGAVGDDGSGLARVEISTDAGRTWQDVTGTDTWSYAWDTGNNSNGMQQVNARAIDHAGLTTQQTLKVGVDNRAPEIRLPDSWFQWDTVTLDIWDNESGLSEARVEIVDPTGLHSKRVIQLDPQQFPLGFKWDRRFQDDTIAEAGTYDLKVIAVDSLGNTTHKTASIRILLDILPAGPTATPQSYVRPEATPTSTPTSISGSSPKATQTAILSAFGGIESTAETITTPTPGLEPTPRSTPTQTNVLDVLQSIFLPDPIQESITKIGSRDSTQKFPRPANTDDSGILWGTAAAAAIGSAMAYVEEEKRKREEEKARQAALDAAEEERREKKQERKLEKMEAKRAQEAAWQAAIRHEKIEDAYLIQNDIKIARLEAEEETRSIIAEIEKKKQAEEKKKKAEEEKKNQELNERMRAYYSAPRQEEKEAANTQPMNWWEKTKSAVNENIIQPANTYLYQPYLKQPIERVQEFIADERSWANEHMVQPTIQGGKELVANGSAWFNENIYQPNQLSLDRAKERTKEFLASESAWFNENIYQPIRPAVDRAKERTKEFLASEFAWMDKEINQPYLQPAIKNFDEKINQPYIQPVIKVIDKKVYEPIFEPVVNDINQYIYQPLERKVTNWWDQYGEWVHGALDVVGVIPGLGEAADGANALLYLAEGRYAEAGISAISMLPILGDFGKIGKVGAEVGEELLEESVEKGVKEVTEGLVENAAEVTLKEAEGELAEKVAKESLEEITEKTAKETGTELIEKTTKETFEEIAEKSVKEIREETAERISREVTEKTAREITNQAATEVAKDTVATVPLVSSKNVSKAITEEVSEETIEQASEETAQFVASLRKQYGDEMVDSFLPFCEKYDINPYDVLTRPPAEGQSLIGWGLGIENPLSPANQSLIELNLTKDEIKHILEKSTVRPDGKIVVLGYGRGATTPYYTLSDKIGGCHLSLAKEVWSPFENAQANFLVDINMPFIEKGIEERKIFLFNIDRSTIIDPQNAGRFSLPELRLIEMPTNNYVRVEFEKYELFVPQELQDSYLEHLPAELLGELQ